MTQITKNVILDLLPLYIGDEASADTVALVEKYLDANPDLAELARQMAQANVHQEVPEPHSKEAEMENFERTKQMLIIRSTIVVSLVAMFLCTAMLIIPLVLRFLQR